MEMIKGIKGHGYHDELVVPIIENTAYEYQLTESFAKAVCFLPMVLVHVTYMLGTLCDVQNFFFLNHV